MSKPDDTLIREVLANQQEIHDLKMRLRSALRVKEKFAIHCNNLQLQLDELRLKDEPVNNEDQAASNPA